MTERILVQAAQSGRSEATDELVERYYPRVYSFVATLQSGDAEDLTQEVFARALGALPRFNGEYQFGAWLLQIARNVCIDEARRQVRRPQPTDPVDLVELETSDSLPDHVWESVSSEIAVATVHRALAKLPKRQRTVLVLRELEGMSYADIAVALRISTRAVEISLSRARKRMRLELKDLDLAEGEQASCRRTANLLASDPAALSYADVLEHLRQCPLCQATARRRSRRAVHGLLGLLGAGAGQLVEVLRRQVAWGHRLMQAVMTSPGTGTMSPLSRLAEVGASVAVATAFSAGSLAATTAAQPIVTPDTPVPVAVPAAGVPEVPPADPGQAGRAGRNRSTGPAAGAGARSGLSPLECELAAVGHLGSGVAGTTPAGPGLTGLGSGQVVSELLSPVNALSPVLACDPTLSQVGAALSRLRSGVQTLATSLAASSQPQAAPPGTQGGPPGGAQTAPQGLGGSGQAPAQVSGRGAAQA
ncbi:MAG TPA: sigma-70 family RNA polymerase sigma factor, partial [Actinomycetota bacterium]|nr:sigma-70 family RNA polymerase sigma factor [Actinomycetota bacterium]